MKSWECWESLKFFCYLKKWLKNNLRKNLKNMNDLVLLYREARWMITEWKQHMLGVPLHWYSDISCAVNTILLWLVSERDSTMTCCLTITLICFTINPISLKTRWREQSVFFIYLSQCLLEGHVSCDQDIHTTLTNVIHTSKHRRDKVDATTDI